MQPSASAQLIGPGWFNNAKYEIKGKPPDSIQDAMNLMTTQERAEQIHLMMESLLADRFKLKAHIETREMPVYELVLAKGGSKMKENPGSTKGGPHQTGTYQGCGDIDP